MARSWFRGRGILARRRGPETQVDDETRVESILAEWQEQLDRGAAPAPEAVIAAHPDLEAPLRGCFAALLAVRGGEARVAGPALRPIAPDRYSVFRPVGRGGMGLVYWAIDSDLNREVAFKVIRAPGTASGEDTPASPRELTPPSADSPATRAFETLKQRFLQEAWVTGALAHPGIVPVYELGQTDAGVPYYTMRFVRGERTLADAIEGAAGAPFEERLHLLEPFLKVCDTIQYAHAQYVVHRDLKPENIALGQFGEVVVLDWGLAKLKGQPGPATDPWRERLRAWREAADVNTLSVALGTPGYMAPEAVAGRIEEIDEQSDVYSLGAILFRLLTGRAVFAFEAFEDLARQVLGGEVPDPQTLNPSIPAPLSALCRAALARDKADRPASVEVLADGIRQWQTQSQLDREVAGWLVEARGRLLEAEPLQGRARVGALDRVLLACDRVVEARPDHKEAHALRARAETLRKAALDAGHRAARRRLLARAAVLLLVVGTGASVLVARELEQRREEAVTARRDAETNLDRARIRGLIATSAEAERAHPMLALLLARSAVRQASPPSETAVSRLYAALVNSHERARFDGHTEQVNSAVFSSSADAVLTASRDGSARIWPVAGGEVRILAHEEPLRDAVFSPSGGHVLTRSEHGHVAYLWDRAGTLIARLQGHEGPLVSARFAPSGEVLLTAAEDGTARLWDLTGAERARLLGHEAPISSAVFSREGDVVLTSSLDKTVRLWDLSGRELSRLEAPAAVWDARFSPSGEEILVSLTDWTSRLWTRAGSELATYRGSFARMSADGAHVVTGIRQQQLCFSDRAGELLSTFSPPGGAAAGFEFLPGGQRVVVACYDASIRVWDPTGVQATALLAGHVGWTESISFSPDGGRVLTASRDRTVRLWEPAGNAQVALRGHTGRIDIAACAPVGMHFLTAARDGTARLWNADGRERAAVPYHSWTGAAFSPAGDRIVVGEADHVARVWDLEGKEVAALRGHEAPIVSISVAADGSELVTASRDMTVRRWDWQGRQLGLLRATRHRPKRALLSPNADRTLVVWVGSRAAQHITGPGASLFDAAGKELAELGAKVRCAAFSADGTHIVTGSYEGVVGIWDAQGQAIVSFQGHEASVLCCAFAPDGKSVLTGADDLTARLWDLQGRPRAVLRGHSAPVVCVAIDGQGKRLLTGGDDQAACLWRMTGERLATLQHEGNIAGVGFSADGALALTASYDGAARLWPVDVAALLENADARVTRDLTPEERERYADLLLK